MSLELVKKLREQTGAGMLDCQKALKESNNDLEKAIELLRKKGIAIAQKRSGNETNNGTINCFLDSQNEYGALVELSCETDFSANTTDMNIFSKEVAQATASLPEESTIETILSARVLNANLSVQEHLDTIIAKIAESIKINNARKFEKQPVGVTNAYIHPGGQIGVLVQIGLANKLELESKTKILALAKDLAMQAAVTNPLCTTPEEVDPLLIAKEKDIIQEQLKSANKPAAVLEKIIEGRINKFYEEVCLLKQKFIKDDKMAVEDLLKTTEKAISNKITLVRFVRYGIGR